MNHLDLDSPVEKKRQQIDAVIDQIGEQIGLPPAAYLDGDDVVVPADMRITDYLQDLISQAIELARKEGKSGEAEHE